MKNKPHRVKEDIILPTNPKTGTLVLSPMENAIYVAAGGYWYDAGSIDTTYFGFYKETIEFHREEMHKEHPDLKRLWEEYELLRIMKGVESVYDQIKKDNK